MVFSPLKLCKLMRSLSCMVDKVQCKIGPALALHQAVAGNECMGLSPIGCHLVVATE